MEDITLFLSFLVASLVFAITLTIGINENFEEQNMQYEKILKAEFNQVFNNYDDYIIYKLNEYEKIKGEI